MSERKGQKRLHVVRSEPTPLSARDIIASLPSKELRMFEPRIRKILGGERKGSPKLLATRDIGSLELLKGSLSDARESETDIREQLATVERQILTQRKTVLGYKNAYDEMTALVDFLRKPLAQEMSSVLAILSVDSQCEPGGDEIIHTFIGSHLQAAVKHIEDQPQNQ